MKSESVFGEMKAFLLLWTTQSLSGLGSAMTSCALVIWSYAQRGSALKTALLMVCSYAPYVLLSLFAGALSDHWDKRRVMLICDSAAAACTLAVLWLLQTGSLQVWHLYVINAVNGFMNTLQQPAFEVATSLLLPRKHYQRVGGMRYFSNACTTILAPVLATALLGLSGIHLVLWFDLATFMTAFCVLLFAIRIPQTAESAQKEAFWPSVQSGLRFLKQHRGILDLMLFLAAINFVASMYNAGLPAMMLSRNGGSERALGLSKAVSGIAMLVGSIAASILKAPRSRVRVVCNTLLISMSTENFFLAFGNSASVWCIGAFLGWMAIPLMNANLDAIMRLNIPENLQGRVFAARNSFQFFTIPLGYLLGGWAVDQVFEPLLAAVTETSWLHACFGAGKGSGAACFFAVLALLGIVVCLVFRKDRHIWALETEK